MRAFFWGGVCGAGAGGGGVFFFFGVGGWVGVLCFGGCSLLVGFCLLVCRCVLFVVVFWAARGLLCVCF